MDVVDTFKAQDKSLIVSENLASKGRRFLATLADFFILFILANTVYFFATYNLTKIMPFYSAAQESSSIALKNVENMYIDSHLIIKDSQGIVATADVTVEKFIQNKLEDKDYDDKGDYIDPFYYSYISYFSGNTIDGITYNYDIKYVNENIYKVNEEVKEPVIWDFSNKESIIHLTSEAKTQINNYLHGERTSKNERYYVKVVTFAQSGLMSAEATLKSTDLYRSNMASVSKNNDIISLSISIGASVTYVVMFLLLFVLVPVLLKNGQTLGKKILRLALSDENGEQISVKNYLLREILELVMFSCITVFIPYLLLGIDAIYLPLIIAGSFRFSLSIYCLIVFIFGLISLIYMIANKDGQTLQDKALKMYCLDLSKDERLIKKHQDGGSDIK